MTKLTNKDHAFIPDTLLTFAKQSIERPDDFGYWGRDEMFKTWGFAGIDMSRDSTIIDEANFHTFQRDIVPQHPDDFAVENFSHWAVGSLDRTLVKVLHNEDDGICLENITDAFVETCEVLLTLRDDYPILDDSMYCDLETDRILKILDYDMPKLVARSAEDWLDNIYIELVDMGVEMCPDADLYPDQDDILRAAHYLNYIDPEYEEEWKEWCWNNNMSFPFELTKKECDGQLSLGLEQDED